MFEQVGNDGKKAFYETAKFNPRELIDMVDLSVSSRGAEEEAHLPTINLFSQNNRMRSFRGIRSVDEHSRQLAKNPEAEKVFVDKCAESIRLGEILNLRANHSSHRGPVIQSGQVFEKTFQSLHGSDQQLPEEEPLLESNANKKTGDDTAVDTKDIILHVSNEVPARSRQPSIGSQY